MPGFTPTHEVPAGGIDAWNAPDPAASPDARLDAGLPVEVLEDTTGWAHVRCSNAWEAWVAAAALVALAPDDGFVSTHRVGPSPLDARDRPDQHHEVAGRLDPGLPVVEVESWGDWVHVRCSNGWEAWVDGRELVPFTNTTDTTADTAAVGASTSTAPVAPLDRYLPLAGAALALVGSMLPWFSAAGVSISAWDLPFVGLFTHEASDVDLDTGPVLLLLVIAGLPLLTRRPLPPWSVGALGGLAVLCAVLALLLPDPKPDFGIGLFLTLLGGAVMIASAAMRWNSSRRS
jgi:SH3-like domain-containing protein